MDETRSVKETRPAFRHIPLPLSYEAIVDEICKFAHLSVDDVRIRIWNEVLNLGWNVGRDVEFFGVTPHRHDQNLEKMYCEGDGFIFETMVYWARPGRQSWSKRALERLQRHSAAVGIGAAEMSILLLGDGVGNDAIFFAREGLTVDYFDVPGSKTYDFAVKRFEYYELLAESIRVLDDYRSCFERQYDAVISFEVLEHLQDPLSTIADIRNLLKVGGIALITEAFGAVHPCYPTHLECNSRLEGRTPFIFLRNGMVLSWYSLTPLFKPAEYVRVGKTRVRDYVRLLTDTGVLKGLTAGPTRRLKRRIHAMFE